ncbi:tRNA(Met) cytidine acetyltransferase TmcA [Amphritea balenae]|uniref:tRNA(Met) cytidine acetyltransferase TmcA n=1 Tax=Amphritea balenae TaxID=452629 RepID=UPI0014747114|nr:GNAT family N-acetyltransferase [Amphritea balenae]GGK59429.1 tRNA(Met) cytidine acetyltransferase TmcA [Amphritea balenae]
MSEIEPLQQYITGLYNAQRGSIYRQLLVLSGSRGWCQQLTELADLDLDNWLWVGEPAVGLLPASPLVVVSGKQAHQVLGQERQGVVFDSWSGFNPNAFGQVAGLLSAGGLFILVTPPLADWSAFDDPEYSSIAVEPYQSKDVGRRFIQHLCRIIRNDPDLVLLQEGIKPEPLDSPGYERSPQPVIEVPYRSRDQHRFVAACETLLSRAPAVAVVTADRGRGKSAALGILAARLMSRKPTDIIITAPSRSAVQSAIQILIELLSDQLVTEAKDCWSYGQSKVRFLLPDQLIQKHLTADLLLVDEAAAIPAPVLRQFLINKSVIFASTIHGYEGTGQGFAVRFLPFLKRTLPDTVFFRMKQPIRWAEGDPFESFTYTALLLDAEPESDTAIGTSSVSFQYRQLDRDLLAQQPELLRQLFGLLVLAHYKTTPGDLRILLDSPNLEVWGGFEIANNNEQLVATALLAREGPIEASLAQAIQAGTRRPTGHLIPQTLLAHAQIPEAACCAGIRVMRIAVMPNFQRRGIGTQMIAAIGRANSKLDWIGTSFGATTALCQFWEGQGMQIQRLGYRRDKVSGTHAAVMLKGISEQGFSLQQQANSRCRKELLQADEYRDLEPELRELLTR